MQTKKSQPSGQQIMPETRSTSFPALSINPPVGISLSASETDDRFYLSLKVSSRSDEAEGTAEATRSVYQGTVRYTQNRVAGGLKTVHLIY